MPLVQVRAPQTSRRKAAEIFSKLGDKLDCFSWVSAIPRYHLTPQQILAPWPGILATQRGWRFIRTGDDISESVDVAQTDLAAWSFSMGDTARLIADYSQQAHRDLERRAERYWPRVLIVPEIGIQAFWVHSPKRGVRDRFYGIPDEQATFPNRGFMKEARRRANIYFAAGPDNDEMKPEPVDAGSA
jgi:hypothetical protein